MDRGGMFVGVGRQGRASASDGAARRGKPGLGKCANAREENNRAVGGWMRWERLDAGVLVSWSSSFLSSPTPPVSECAVGQEDARTKRLTRFACLSQGSLVSCVGPADPITCVVAMCGRLGLEN